MAVVDKTATANFTAATQLAVLRDLFSKGANIGALLATAAVAAADDDGSDYRLFTGRNAKERPLLILIGNTAITNGTDYDLGIFDTNGGAVLVPECFVDTMDLSSAHAELFPGVALNGMKDVLPAVHGKQLYEFAGHTTANARDSYDIVATANTVGTAAGTITALYIFALAA